MHVFGTLLVELSTSHLILQNAYSTSGVILVLLALQRRSNAPHCDTSSIDVTLGAMPKALVIGTLLPHAAAWSAVCGSVVCLPVHVICCWMYLYLGVSGEWASLVE